MSNDTIGERATLIPPVSAEEIARRWRADDEMAAGLIHEPGTGGAMPLYAISELALDDLEAIILGEVNSENQTLGLGFIRAARENGMIFDPAHSAVMREEAQTRATIAEQQRDLLSRQVDSLVQRLAGSHVAAGSFDMAAAQGFVQKEILPINQVLAQIAAQPQEQGDA